MQDRMQNTIALAYPASGCKSNSIGHFLIKKRNSLKGYLLSCPSGVLVCFSSGSTLIGLLKSKLCLPSS
jgi:hypothetical protein